MHGRRALAPLPSIARRHDGRPRRGRGRWAGTTRGLGRDPELDRGIGLYRTGVFTTQKTWLWCTAADVQTMRNIVDHQTDHTRTNQSRYFDYMRAHDRYSDPGHKTVPRPGRLDRGPPSFRRQPLPALSRAHLQFGAPSAVTNLRKTNLTGRPVGRTRRPRMGVDGVYRDRGPCPDNELHGHHRACRRPALGTPEPHVRLRHAAGHEADAEPVPSVDPRRPWHYARVRMAWESRWVSIQPLGGEKLPELGRGRAVGPGRRRGAGGSAPDGGRPRRRRSPPSPSGPTGCR